MTLKLIKGKIEFDDLSPLPQLPDFKKDLLS